MKIGAGASLYGVTRTLLPQRNKTQKKTSLVTLYSPARAGRDRGAKTPYRIVMKFCTGVDVPDMITQAKFCGYRLIGFGDSKGQIFQFFIDFRCRP